MQPLIHTTRIITDKLGKRVNVAVIPTRAVLIHKLGKLLVIFGKADLELPFRNRSGIFLFVGYTAPRTESASCVIDTFTRISVLERSVGIMKEIPAGKDGENAGKALEILDHIGGEPAEKRGILAVGNGIDRLTDIGFIFVPFVGHFRSTSFFSANFSTDSQSTSQRYDRLLRATTYLTAVVGLQISLTSSKHFFATASR